MRITDAALRQRSTVFFLMTAMIVLGLLAYRTLPRESFPDVDIPLILVFVPYPGAAPSEVESQIVTPLERELTGLAGLEELSSTSQESLAVVTVEFVSGTDIDDALQKVRDRVDLAEIDFPDDAEEPAVREISFADMPILQVNLYGDVGPVVLKNLAEDLQDEIEALRGVLRASLVGGLEREVKVDVDPEKLRLYDLSLDDVVDAVDHENVSIPGGDLDLGDVTYAVRVPGEVDDPLAVADFVIEAPDGRPIFVRDVAAVSFGFEDRSSYARIDGQEAVALLVQKRIGANIIEVADAIKEIVGRSQERWPAGVRATLLADRSKEIRQQVRDLENSILSGLLLVIGVLMFVLGLRTAVFVGLAIPFSMLLTFLVIQLAGVTLNMVVLFALVLAVGMLVDNAVVVIENIYRHRQEGAGRVEAARDATREVGGAIAASTFTTLGAFAPLLVWPGVIGDFMSYLPWTVSLALLASLVVAFTLNPVICAVFMPAVEPRSGGSAAAAGGSLKDRLGDRIAEGYRRLLGWALDRRLRIVGGTLAVFVAVFAAFVRFSTGVEFLPETEPNQIVVDVELPSGARLEKTDGVVRQLERRLAGLSDLRVMASGVGEGSQDEGFGGSSGTPNLGRLTIDLHDREDRRRSSFLTLADGRQLVRGIPGATLDVDQPDHGPPVGAPLAIEITGEDFNTLGEIAGRVRREVEGIPGLVSLEDDFDLARPEVVVVVDRVAAARLGLTTNDIASTVRTAVNGRQASTYRRGDEEIDITVRLAEGARRSLDDLRRLAVVTEDGEHVPLGAVATVSRSSSLTSIRHRDRKRMVTISGNVADTRLADPVRREAERRLAAVPDLLPAAGYGLAFAGQKEEEEESKEFLSRAFLYALVIVLAMMVGKFNSVLIPGIIMTSVLMSMIGVLLGLLVTRMPFSIIMTGVGVISLAGIVVNNAIVLLDYGEKLRTGVVGPGNLPRREVVVATGLRRLRPVLLTAVTTILGLVPLTTGVEFDFRSLAFNTGSESSQYWKAMGVSVIFGLAFATFLTLVLVPVLYDLLLQLRERSGRVAEPAPAKETVGEPAPAGVAET